MFEAMGVDPRRFSDQSCRSSTRPHGQVVAGNSLPPVRLGGAGKTLKLDARTLDHLLQVDHELAIHRVVCSSEGIQSRKARGVEDPEHAQLLKAAFVDAGEEPPS